MKYFLVLPVLALLSAASPSHRPATRPAFFRVRTPLRTDRFSLHSIGLQADPNGYVIVGYEESTAVRRRSISVTVANADGQRLWSRTFGARRVVKDLRALRTSDGGLLVWGREEPAGPGHSYPYLLRVGAKGESLWTRTYGRCHRPPCAVAQTPDGGFVAAGSVYDPNGTKMYLLKTDARGDTVWCRSRGDRYRQFCNSAQQTTDGGYIMTGEADGDVYIVRTDSSGNMLWSRSYGSAGVDYDQGRSVQQTKDGGFAVAGQFQRHGQPVDYDAYLVRTDGNGDSVWTRTYGGKGAQYGEWVRQTADGGFIMVGTDIQSRTQGFMTPGDAKTYVVRTHPNGDTLWTRTFDDTLRSGNRSVFKTADDGLVFATLTSATDSGEVCINVTTIDADGHVARPK